MTETLQRPAVDAADWVLCTACRRIVYERRLLRNLRVCPECGQHQRLTAGQRLDLLLDAGSVRSLDLEVTDGDPLGFVDAKPYPQRLREARAATGLAEAVVCCRGAIHGNAVIVAVMDFRFLGGSLGAAVGEMITQAAEIALAERTPLLLVTASGGARMQEGAIALMQMAKTCQALGRLDEAGILTVALVTDPTFGGVAASYATVCDVIIAEPGARLGFAGRRVIEQTTHERLPDEFQTVEFLRDHGMLDLVVPRAGLRATLARLLSIGARRTVPGRAAPVADPRISEPALVPDQDAWESVQRARDLRRPTTLDYCATILDEFVELHGDRLQGDCPAIVGGMARIGEMPVMVIGHQKGHAVADLIARNFGMASPAGYRKSARLMRMAAKLGLPVVTLVDTPGAHPGRQAEESGQANAIAENLRLMGSLPTPIVSVVIGEGGSGGALALAVANQVLAFSNAVYSVISPEGCASILWKDAAEAPRAARALRVGARDLLRHGIVDAVIPEPADGTGAAPAVAARSLRAAIVAALRELAPRDGARLVDERRRRFRAFPVRASKGYEGE
ncbi:acetyl-CoA carboxylase carboxyl transferase subunit alpha [Actinoplanes sp. NPDC004185]